MEESARGCSRSTPVHYYIDHSPYFITAATYHHQSLLDDDIKDRLIGLMHETFTEYGWQLEHWVVLDDHYHLLASSRRGRVLPRIVGKLHNLSAQWINHRHPPATRRHAKVWCNYWDYCPRNERDYNIRLCYLLNNPLKHGYVENLTDWRWSSFQRLLAKCGDDALRDIFRRHREYRELSLPEDP